jgi:type IV secretion system protein TrbG
MKQPLPPADTLVSAPEPVQEAPAPVCTERTPVIVEVPVPVAMPCQLKPPPEFTEVSYRPGKNGKGGSKGAGQQVDGVNAGARLGPKEANWVNSVHVYQYMPGALYQVHTAVLQVTTILFQPGETLQAVAAGDTERWEVAQALVGGEKGQQQVVMIKPKWTNIRTNLTITTSKRLYLVELYSNENNTYMAAVSWEYPQEAPMIVHAVTPEQVALQAAQQAAQQAATRLAEFPPNTRLCGVRADEPRLDFGYRMSTKKAAPAWKPERVFDDGGHTYVQFPVNFETMEAPVLVLRSAEGNIQVTNYQVKYGCYIVDRLFNEAELRVGEKSPTVVKISRVTPR